MHAPIRPKYNIGVLRKKKKKLDLGYFKNYSLILIYAGNLVLPPKGTRIRNGDSYSNPMSQIYMSYICIYEGLPIIENKYIIENEMEKIEEGRGE